MTVKLLVDRPIDGKEYKAGNLCDTDDSTEAGLISSKLAIADLTGGTAYVAPTVQQQIVPVTATTNLTGGISIPALSQMTSGVTLSRSLSINDSDQVLKCNSGSAIVLTIPNDATALWSGLNSVGAYQAGVGAVSFAAGAGVTLRGTAPTPTRYTTQGVMRVAENEWAYL